MGRAFAGAKNQKHARATKVRASRRRESGKLVASWSGGEELLIGRFAPWK